MKKSIAMKWADALESGEYEQTQGALREGDSFCCLGVLCNLHAQAKPKIAANEHKTKYYMGHEGELPPEVMAWAGVKSDEGDFYVKGSDEPQSLINMNDTERLTFPKIAKVIRKHYKEL